MGRSAIDEEAIRLIEQANPDVQFDWPRILKQTPESRPGDRDIPEQPRAPEPPPDRRAQKVARRAPARTPEIAAVEQSPDVSPLSEPEGAAFRRLGAEALARLRARYAEIMARIAERQAEEAEKDELKARAERLNPDSWVTDADVDAGLEQYEAVYESLRAVVGHARKRRDRA